MAASNVEVNVCFVYGMHGHCDRSPHDFCYVIAFLLTHHSSHPESQPLIFEFAVQTPGRIIVQRDVARPIFMNFQTFVRHC